MTKLLVGSSCTIVLATILILALTQREVPQPTVKAPDPRYSAPAIDAVIAKDAQDFTVLINNEDMAARWRGTGVLLDSTTVLTCAHVVPKDKSTKTLWIYPYPGDQVVRAKLRFINYRQDLALLELLTPALGHKVPAFAQKAVIGEPIVSVGNIRGYMLWFVSYGIISGEHGRWLLTDAMIRGGNSGGPWVNARGEIVALTDVGWVDEESAIAGGVPVQELRKFLAQAK